MVRVVIDLKAMVRATVPKIDPVPASVNAEPAELLPAAVAVERHKAAVLNVADQVALAADNVAPVVRVADRP